jgi:hypothetical protein
MANQFSGLVWTIDTASSTVYGKGGPMIIRAVKWESPSATNNDQVVITDGISGNRIWASVAQGPQWDSGQINFTPPLKPLGGIIVATLASGVLYVFLA